MKVQVDNRIVEMVLIRPEEHKSNSVIYHELNEKGLHVSEHSFRDDMFESGRSYSFFTNGHHYRTGNMVGDMCNNPDCFGMCKKE